LKLKEQLHDLVVLSIEPISKSRELGLWLCRLRHNDCHVIVVVINNRPLVGTSQQLHNQSQQHDEYVNGILHPRILLRMVMGHPTKVNICAYPLQNRPNPAGGTRFWVPFAQNPLNGMHSIRKTTIYCIACPSAYNIMGFRV
jgi:hypothetical protein